MRRFGVRDRGGVPAQMAAGRRVYAIGDINGRADLLTALLEQIDADFARTAPAHVTQCLVFLGDYIDRGLESRRCVDVLLARAETGVETHFLLGRHDLAMLRFLGMPAHARRWLEIGGTETLFSYGVRGPKDAGDPAQLQRAAHALEAAMPAQHRRFFNNLRPHLRLGDYLFVHAGLRPGVPLERQSEVDLVSIREPFLNGRDAWPFVVVHGHTPVETMYADGRRIAVDTGAYVTGRLTAVCLEGTEIRRLST